MSDRPLDWDKVAEYAELIQKGAWKLDGMDIDPDGRGAHIRLAQATGNGQHRAAAIAHRPIASVAMPALESWRTVWRLGFVPSLSDKALAALHQALENDDPRLTQGSTTTPPPLMCVQDWPVEAACALGFCGWQGEGLNTVGETEEFFAKCCFEADQRLGEAAACRFFLNWYDDTPRDQMRAELAEEVRRAICERNGGVGTTDLF